MAILQHPSVGPGGKWSGTLPWVWWMMRRPISVPRRCPDVPAAWLQRQQKRHLWPSQHFSCPNRSHRHQAGSCYPAGGPEEENLPRGQRQQLLLPSASDSSRGTEPSSVLHSPCPCCPHSPSSPQPETQELSKQWAFCKKWLSHFRRELWALYGLLQWLCMVGWLEDLQFLSMSTVICVLAASALFLSPFYILNQKTLQVRPVNLKSLLQSVKETISLLYYWIQDSFSSLCLHM